MEKESDSLVSVLEIRHDRFLSQSASVTDILSFDIQSGKLQLSQGKEKNRSPAIPSFDMQNGKLNLSQGKEKN